MSLVAPPYFVFTGLDNRLLDNGFVYIGVQGQDPETHPIPIFSNAEMTIPLSQPLRTKAGVLSDGDNPVTVYVATGYSIRVRDYAMSTVYFRETADAIDQGVREDLAGNGGAALVGTADGGDVQAALDDLDSALVDASRPTDNSALVRGLMSSSSSIFLLGDSITCAAGATAYENGFSYLTARSILNANDLGYDRNAGYGYHTVVNMVNAVDEADATLGGGAATSGGGVVNSRLTIPAGGSIQITGRQLASIDVIYDGSASTGSLVFKLNGATIATKPVSGTGLQNTFPTFLSAGNNINTTDVVRIEVTGGTVVVTGLLPLRPVTNVPLVYVAGETGTGYQDYTDAASMTEIAYYLNLFRTGVPKVMIHALGTNNIYSVGKALTPANTVTALSDLIAGINARATNVNHVIQIPPKADEGVFPVVLPGYTYEDYVTALRNFARAQGHGLIQQNLAGVESYLSDGVHPTNAGHLIMAANASKVLGIGYNGVVKTLPASTTSVTTGTNTLGTNWGLFGGIANSAKKTNNTVALTGILAPAGGATTTALVLPSGYRPAGRTCYFVGRSDAGAAPFSIDTSGNVILASVPASWFSLEGINFQIAQ